ncbi:MAG: DNA mismatch repair protein [Vezdaea aestivalis]|nr:MAG: DNA mismatch repair protein [Vezdaea aestivalis]
MDIDTDDNAPRGTKRSAQDADLFQVDAPKRIKALDQDVVNKIAAGEIIVAPVHALKELLENAVDAGSTALEVLVKEGGLKLLQITDNGHGINKDDLPILCERFTTSKLKTFEDLSSIGTYGFRGEALASISHIAHLAVTTKVKESSCAYRAHYSSGKLVPAKPGQAPLPTPIAGRPGTQITVEDLFYNIPTRRRAFRSPSEEYAKVLDLVGRYAVHCEGVSFSCKKHGESSLSISVSSVATTTDRIRSIYGTAIAAELISYSTTSEKYGYKASGFATNSNHQSKRTTLLLFINHRSVEATALRKSLEATYAQFLPKGGHPFIYLDLEIDPARLDVNVHPTKREVHFLHEDEITVELCDALREKLAAVDTSRTFMVQSLLPGASKNVTDASQIPSFSIPTITKHTPTRVYENNLVRTDPKTRKITSMFSPATPLQLLPNAGTDSDQDDNSSLPGSRSPTSCKLTSVVTLRSAVKANIHGGLTQTLATHTFVGVVDVGKRIAAIQSGVKLLLVDYGMLTNALFYQLGLTDFGNFGHIKLVPPLSLRELLEVGAEVERQNMASSEDSTSSDKVDWEHVITKCFDQLLSRREMLAEYFSIRISSNGQLETLPLLLKGYDPPLSKLPRFLLNLGPKVDWSAEQACFETFLTQLAEWYVPEFLPPEDVGATQPKSAGDQEGDNVEDEVKQRRAHVVHSLEHVIFPTLRARLVATNDMIEGFVEVADLKGLYRVFERC